MKDADYNFKVAVVGCGAWGRNLARNFHQLGVLDCIVENHTDVVIELESQYNITNQNLDNVLQNPNIKAVVVAVPTVSHYAIAKQVLMAGKDLFIEKPVTTSLQQAEELVDLAEKRNCVFMVGHLPQYHPAFQTLKSIVEQGRIGNISYIYSNRLNLGRIRADENCMWDLAPHDISMILGLVSADVNETYTHASANLVDNIIDTALVSLIFNNGVKGHVFNSWLHPFKEHRLVVVGDSGMLVFDDGKPWDTKLALYQHDIKNIDQQRFLTQYNDPEYILINQDEPLNIECSHFIECVRDRSEPLTGPSEAIRVMRVLENINTNISSYSAKNNAKKLVQNL